MDESMSFEIQVKTTRVDTTIVDKGIKTVKDLRKYFTEFGRRGELWGYVVNKYRHRAWSDEFTTKVIVIIQCSNTVATQDIEFDDATSFVKFLDDNTQIAEALGYTKKKNHNSSG